MLHARVSIWYEENNIHLAELIFSPGPLLWVAASSGVFPGMINTVDGGSGKPLPNLLLYRGSIREECIKLVGFIPVGLIFLVKRHLLSSLNSGGNSSRARASASE